MGYRRKRERERTSKPITNNFTELDYGCGCKPSHHTGGFAAGARKASVDPLDWSEAFVIREPKVIYSPSYLYGTL